MMRTGVAALGALSLINLAAAKPSGHHRRHQQLHDKRQEVDVVYETEYSYVTTQLPNVIVMVDENGAPYSTSTEGQVAATSAAASVVASSAPVYTEVVASSAVASSAVAAPTSIYVAPTTLASVYKAKVSKASTSAPPAYTSKAAAPSTKASSSAAASPSASSGGLGGPSGYGIVYSPYNADGTCKSQDDVNSDFSSIHSWAQSNNEDFSFVRIYGTDCNQVSTVLSAANDYNLKIFAGVFNIWDDKSFTDELTLLTKAAGNDWSRFDTISIGNEVVNGGKLAAADVAGKVAAARSTLTAAGYSGKIVAVDTLVAMIANPELCEHSDYVAVNSHPFFDGNVAAEDSGPWLLEQMQRVSQVCGGKDVWISETGWPTQGNTNGIAVPSTENQKAAIASMKKSVTSNIVWFTAFNDMWKTNTAATFNAEQYWGICN